MQLNYPISWFKHSGIYQFMSGNNKTSINVDKILIWGYNKIFK